MLLGSTTSHLNKAMIEEEEVIEEAMHAKYDP